MTNKLIHDTLKLYYGKIPYFRIIFLDRISITKLKCYYAKVTLNVSEP